MGRGLGGIDDDYDDDDDDDYVEERKYLFWRWHAFEICNLLFETFA
jgi:hypothetical protein